MKKPENRRPKAETEKRVEDYAEHLFGYTASEALKVYREMGGCGQPSVHVLIGSSFKSGQPSTGALSGHLATGFEEALEKFETRTPIAEIAAWCIEQKEARLWLSNDCAEVTRILCVLEEEGEHDGNWDWRIRDGEILLSLRFVRKGSSL